MEDFFYILLVIGWIAYGIYSATKKNKPKSNSPTQASTPAAQEKDPIESVFETFFQGSSPAPIESPVPYSIEDDYQEVERYEELDYVEEESYLDVVPETQVQSKIDTYEGSDNIEQAIQIIDDEDSDMISKSAIGVINTEQKELSFSFDLRQAVIAKAILDRPYQ